VGVAEKRFAKQNLCSEGEPQQKVHHELQNFNGLGLMRFPFTFSFLPLTFLLPFYHKFSKSKIACP
jgi:hypothetical protein